MLSSLAGQCDLQVMPEMKHLMHMTVYSFGFRDIKCTDASTTVIGWIWHLQQVAQHLYIAALQSRSLYELHIIITSRPQALNEPGLSVTP